VEDSSSSAKKHCGVLLWTVDSMLRRVSAQPDIVEERAVIAVVKTEERIANTTHPSYAYQNASFCALNITSVRRSLHSHLLGCSVCVIKLSQSQQVRLLKIKRVCELGHVI
jgi:hypothetical protein